MTATSRLAVPSLIIAAAFSLHAAPQLGGMAYSNAFPDAASIANFHKYYTAGDPVYGGLEWGIYATGGPTSDDGYVVPYVQTNQTEWDAGRAINEFGVFYDQSPAAVLTDALVYCSVQCRAWVGHFVGAAARMNADNSLYAAVFGTPDGSAWRLRIIKRAANGSVSILADQSLGALIAWRNYRVEFQCFGNELIARLVDLYNGSQAGEVTATDSTITGPGACGIVAQAVLDGPPWTDHKSPVWDVVAFEMLPPPPDTNIYLHIDVRKAGTGEAIPAVLQLRYNNSGGAFLPQSTAGWTDPQGVFTFGPTWHQKVGASPATVWIQAYQGDEFEYTNLTVSVPASGTNITIYLTPRVDMSALGWWAGGDHNHLGRGGKKPWKHNGGTLSMEYMATVLSALGYDWWACGVNGGWEIENAGDPLSDNATVRTVMYYADAGLRQACNNFNSNYPAALNLWYGNEHAKTRYGHLWSVGKSTAANGDYPHPNTYPAKSGYGDGFIHNWWALYDGNMDLWMYGLGSQAQDWYWPQYSDTAALELPPYHEIVWALNNANVYSIWAHLTATYPPMYTKLLPFDLLAGVKIGGVAMIGADEATSFNMCLDGYNRGYQFAGFGENDTAYDNATFPRNYTFIYCPVVTKQSFDLNTVLEWGCRSNKTISSSGALAILDVDDGAITIGDNVAADGASHTLRIRAWANTRPGDVLASVSLYRNGAVFRSWSPNTTSFETNVVVSETERAYYLLRVNDNVAARKCITSPIYFVPDPLKPVPPPLRGTVAGGVYDYRGNAIPGVTVDLLYTGALYATTVGDAAGKYRFTNAPADCVLHFHNGAGLDERRSPILHDEAMNDYLL
ncbi:hypothetical protein GX586_07465, partial [bacterium]|nr:hypothetical protein [bacterium]